MKNLLIISVLILYSGSLFSQSKNETEPQSLKFTTHSPGDVSISLSGSKLFNNPYEPVVAGGFKMRIFVGKRISFDADLLVGKDYIHFGPGIFGLPLWFFGTKLFNSDDDSLDGGGFFGLIMMILSAEHVAYHFPIQNSTDVSPFVSMLRFKQLNIDDINVAKEDNYAHASFVAGFEVNQYFKRFMLSPYMEYNIAYDGYFQGFNFGINLGYYFPAPK